MTKGSDKKKKEEEPTRENEKDEKLDNSSKKGKEEEKKDEEKEKNKEEKKEEIKEETKVIEEKKKQIEEEKQSIIKKDETDEILTEKKISENKAKKKKKQEDNKETEPKPSDELGSSVPHPNSLNMHSVLDMMVGLNMYFSNVQSILPSLPGLSVFSAEKMSMGFKEINLEYDFDILQIPDMGRSYFEEKSGSIQFSTLDEYILAKIAFIWKIFEENFGFIYEPEKVIYQGESIKDPEKLGVPISKILTFADYEDLRQQVVRHCRPRAGILTHTVQLDAMGTLLKRMVREFALLRFNEFVGRENENYDKLYRFIMFVNFYDSTLARYPILTSNTEVVQPFEYTWDIMNVLNNVPAELPLRIQNIIEMVRPEIKRRPVRINDIVGAASLSLSRSSVLNALIHISYKRSMDEEMAHIIRAYMLPGLIKIRFEFDTFNERNYVNAIMALLMKLSFRYSGLESETMIDRHTAADIDRIILTGLTVMGLKLMPNPENIMNPLNMQINPNLGREELAILAAVEHLATGENGEGWLDGGEILRAQDEWIDEIYPGIERRPVYGPFKRDVTRVAFEEAIPAYVARWRLLNAIKDVIRHTKETAKSGLLVYIDIFARNLTDFFFRINEYCYRNFYTGFRMTGNHMINKMQHDRDFLGLKPEITIRPETMIYMIFSFDASEMIKRQITIMDQLNSEIVFHNSIRKMSLNYRIVREVINELRLRNEYTRSNIIKMAAALTKDGYISKVIEDYDSSKQLILLPENFFRWESLRVHEIIPNLFQVALRNPEYLGIVRQFDFQLSEPFPTLEEIREMSNNGQLLTNRRDLQYIIPTTTIRIQDISQRVADGNFKAFLKRGISSNDLLRFRIPVPFSRQFVDKSVDHALPINVSWSGVVGEFRAKRDIHISPITIYDMYFIRRNRILWDDYVNSFNTNTSAYANDGALALRRIEDANIGRFFSPILCLRRCVVIVNYLDKFGKSVE
jgi:hypothetical protein